MNIMRLLRRKSQAPVLAALALAVVLNGAAGAQGDNYATTPRKGEALLESADAEKVLAELSVRFKANPYLKAKMISKVDDLMGERTEEGELLLDRNGRVLRKFTKPDQKIWLLNAGQLSEYVPKLRKEVAVKDFSKAPKKLELVQAAVTMDIRPLKQFFVVSVFRGPVGAETAAQQIRLVLTKNPECKEPLPYKRIEASIAATALLFREIQYIPDQGDTVTEWYSDVQKIEKPTDDAFSGAIPADVPRKVDVVESVGSTPDKK
jgi:hypothetical protein